MNNIDRIKRFATIVLFITTLAACMGELTVETVLDETNTPLGAGVEIYINGEKVGITDTNSQYINLLEVGEYTVRAVIPGLVAAERNIVILERQKLNLQLKLQASNIIKQAQLNIQPIVNGILPINFDSFVVDIIHEQSTSLRFIDQLRLINLREPDNWLDLTPFFTLSDNGEIQVNNLELLRDELYYTPYGKMRFSLYAEDNQSNVISETQEFFVGKYQINGQLQAPASQPNISLANLTVTANFMVDDLQLTTTSDENGRFSFNHLPEGNWEFSVKYIENAIKYKNHSGIHLDTNKNLMLTLVTTEDILNNVPYFEVSDLLSSPFHSAVNETRFEDQPESNNPPKFIKQINTNDVVVYAASASTNIADLDAKAITVPAGTEKILLSYAINSNEYPDYVKSQSSFNDIWLVTVTSADGTTLFKESKQVNAQLWAEPVWQSNGSTGEIIHAIDVSTLTSQAVDITLQVSATNIGDSSFTTYAFAKLHFIPKLSVNAINCINSEKFSIPAITASNNFEKKCQVELHLPDEATISHVTANIIDDSTDNVLMTVVNEPLGTRAKLLNRNTLEVTISMNNDYPSSINGVPPSTDEIKYQFDITAQLGQESLNAVKYSRPFFALWQLPSNINRYGFREIGGDGWTTKGGYNWLVYQQATLPAVNDISGEHGLSLRQVNDETGTDIDIYHFTDLTFGLQSGALNYLALRTNVLLAFTGNNLAIAQVKQWIEAARNGLDQLTSNDTVAEIKFSRGAAGLVLPSGWLKILMETGELNIGSLTINLNLLPWHNNRVAFRNDFNTRSEINLYDDELNN